ncbi:hypothetical protein [Motiliproteus sp. MSK22-1]|uniref:hypothetical protein n=1 Tax=Motiliproteus sp. MSK22-1 TaxID=1897630 RepID=UPI0009771747|nr:hypothetical protein [Motiliproteus sp. MSK22-1]OMH28119.1 hypothetical protein BGP75_22415 [Motiliproteus sp. MSK22-1]
MVSNRVRHFLYELDEIETRARKNFGDCTGLYFHYITREYMRYWRELQRQEPEQLKGKAWDELQFFFDQKLRDLAWARFDMYWMIFEYDGKQLYPEDHEPGPFWRK